MVARPRDHSGASSRSSALALTAHFSESCRRWTRCSRPRKPSPPRAVAARRCNRSPRISPRRTRPTGIAFRMYFMTLVAADVGALVGYKIGCTSAVMQRYLGIPHPCGGGVFAQGVHPSGVSLRSKDFVRVGVECEIAVRLAHDLSPSSAPFTAQAVAAAIEAVSACDRDRRRPLCPLANHRRTDPGGGRLLRCRVRARRPC